MELFVVKFYTGCDRPSIKGNGFDGLTIGETREDAEEFISFINSLIKEKQNGKESNNSSSPQN